MQVVACADLSTINSTNVLPGMKDYTKRNLLTFDIEDWYFSNVLDIPVNRWDELESRIVPQLNEILQLLKETDNKATFFTVAIVARRYPSVIKRITDEGHELAFHSYSHRMLTEQTAEEFEYDVKNSQEIFSSITRQKLLGFRAPSWSLTDKNKTYVINILEKNGFLYDSSIFPFKTYLYGDDKAPCYPYILTADNGGSIFELPPSILQYSNFRIPFSGGFYFRVLPYTFIKSAIKSTNKKGYPAVIYLHAYDMDPGQPRIVTSFKNRFIHYANTKRCKEKFKKLLHDFRFGRMDEYVKGLTDRINY